MEAAAKSGAMRRAANAAWGARGARTETAPERSLPERRPPAKSLFQAAWKALRHDAPKRKDAGQER